MYSYFRSLFKSKLFLTFLGFIIFIYGCGVGRYKLFPFKIIKLVQDFPYYCEDNPYSKNCSEVTEKKKWLSPTNDIKFALSEIKELNINPNFFREELLKKVILPKELLEIKKSSQSNNRDIITAKMYGIKNFSILSKSDIRGKCLNIYIQGHQGDPFKFDYHKNILENSNNKGCDFLSTSMLGLGQNESPASFPSIFGELNLSSIEAKTHENYAYFLDKENPDVDPLALFLSPHYWVIKELEKDYEEINILGISGGGWQTVWLSALIPEIDVSISYAGSLPISYRIRPTVVWGDWEANFSQIYRDFSYWKIYALRTIDSQGINSRKSYFVFNDKDNCCFNDPQASKFKMAVELLDQKNWNVLIDKSETHSMNVDIINKILSL